MLRRAMTGAVILAAVLGLRPAAAADCDPTAAPCGYELDTGVYHAALPASNGPHAAIVFLHGWGGTGEATIRNKGLVSAFTSRGYAFLAPTGMPRDGGRRSGGFWNSRRMVAEGFRDDMAFIDAVIAHAAETLKIDRNRVMIGGFSGGGMMTWRIACDAPSMAAAYSPISGLMWRPLPETCAGPARLIHVHGWDDPVVPMEGRSVAGGRITQGDLFVGLNLLRDAFGCKADPPDEAGMADGFLRRAWTDCAPGAHLELVLHAGGHSVPRGWATMAMDWFETVTSEKATQ